MTLRFAPLLAASFVSTSVALVACSDGGADNPVAVGGDSLSVLGDGNVVQVGKVRVVPNPAVPGDTVKLVFDLRVMPERTVTMTVFIDGTAHAGQTRTARFDGPFEFVLGPAADLIAAFGRGTHSARLDLRVNEGGRVIISQGVSLELQ